MIPEIGVMVGLYEPYVDAVGSRSDLNYLFAEMLGNITVSHLNVGGGQTPDVRRVTGGLLGAGRLRPLRGVAADVDADLVERADGERRDRGRLRLLRHRTYERRSTPANPLPLIWFLWRQRCAGGRHHPQIHQPDIPVI